MTRLSKLLLLFAFACILIALFAPIYAQNSLPISAELCAPVVEHLWTTASSACINKPFGYVCNGGAAPAAEPAGLVSGALAPLGALVEVSAVDALRTPPIMTENGSAGIVWLRLPDPINVSALMIGSVTLFDVTPPDFAAWTSMVVNTDPAFPTCLAAPKSVLILQSDVQSRLAVNGSSLVLGGTVLIATDDTKTVFIALSGASSVLALGQQQLLLSGQQVNVAHNSGAVAAPSAPPTAPTPLDTEYLINLPVPLFDRPLILPQPGFASTQGEINLRVSPDVYSGVITQVPGGQALTILGRNPDNTWYHVRLENGETGWMLAELLAANTGTISAIYVETPLPPQRYGELGTRGHIRAPAGVNLRRGPETTFPAVGLVADGTTVNLLARSPYQNSWVKVDANGMVGWLSLVTIETQAYIDALPIDYTAPPFPTPTPIPGSFGNAFPDPESGN